MKVVSYRRRKRDFIEEVIMKCFIGSKTSKRKYCFIEDDMEGDKDLFRR